MAQLKSTNITGNLAVTGNILASKIIKLSGTDDDILMGDGSTTSKQGLIDSLEAAMEGNSWRPIKYDSITLNDTSTALEFVAGSNIGLTFTGGKLTINNNYSYSLPPAANGTLGGIQIGYTASGANLPVQLSSEQAYVALTKSAIESVVTIPTVNDGTLTLKASDGATATQRTFTANDADNVTFEVKHAVPSGAAVGNYGPSAGGEQEAKGTLDITVPQITTDKFGHITAVTNKTFKVTDTNNDTQVTQTVTTSSNTSKRPILLGSSYSDATTPSFSTTTNTVYASHNIYVAPKDGYLYAAKLYSGGKEVLTSHQNLDGYVKGPTTSTNNAIPLFNGTDGETIKNSDLTVDTNRNLDGVNTLGCETIRFSAENQPTITASLVCSGIVVEGIETPTIYAPTTSGGTTYGPGENGQVLKSNGETVYWGTDNSGGDDSSNWINLVFSHQRGTYDEFEAHIWYQTNIVFSDSVVNGTYTQSLNLTPFSRFSQANRYIIAFNDSCSVSCYGFLNLSPVPDRDNTYRLEFTGIDTSHQAYGINIACGETTYQIKITLTNNIFVD